MPHLTFDLDHFEISHDQAINAQSFFTQIPAKYWQIYRNDKLFFV